MKLRHTVIYLLILVLAGGYYYYFEIIKKEEKQAAENEARKVFHFNTEELHALEVFARDKTPVSLKKETRWQIVEPARTEVDKAAFQSFLNTLSNLQSEREVIASAEDLKVYGLHEPSLRIRFQSGDQRQEIILGDKIPVGGGYYAKVGEKPNVILIAESNWGVLNKGFDELRIRELFSFQPEDVAELQVDWQDGAVVRLKEQESPKSWKAPDQPRLRIKDSKVQNVLEQIQWLRAQKFLDNDIKNLEPHGLSSPYASVKLQLKKGQALELRLAKAEKDAKHAVALSSELPAIVEVGGEIMDDLPRNVQALEDRSLFGIAKEDVKAVKWRLGETAGHAIEMSENKWGLKKDDGPATPLKDSWRVETLLWDLDDSEYQDKAERQPDIPQQPHARLEFRNGEKELLTLIWERNAEKKSSPVTVWILREGAVEAVHVSEESMSKIEKDLELLLKPDQNES